MTPPLTATIQLRTGTNRQFLLRFLVAFTVTKSATSGTDQKLQLLLETQSGSSVSVLC